MLGKFLFFFLQIDRKKLGSCSTLARRALRVVPPKHSLYLVIFTLLGHSTKRYLSEYYTTPKLRSRTMVQAKLHCKCDLIAPILKYVFWKTLVSSGCCSILFFPMVSYARPTLGKTLEKPLGQHSGNARFCSRLARGSLGNRSILLELARACSSLLDCCSIFARQDARQIPPIKRSAKTLGRHSAKRSKNARKRQF